MMINLRGLNAMNNVNVMVDSYTCTGCGRCILFCPHGYISMIKGDLGWDIY